MEEVREEELSECNITKDNYKNVLWITRACGRLSVALSVVLVKDCLACKA